LDLPARANIQLVNLKSQYKPFEIVNPEGGVLFHTYNSERSYSMFEWWNHWPVAQIASSGRPAMAADRPSHTSLSDIYWGDYNATQHTETKIMISGLTAEGPSHLLKLAKSWLSPPTAHASGTGVSGITYDPTQRVYVVTRSAGSPNSPITVSFDATESSPLFHPAIMVENWNAGAKAQVIDPAQSSSIVRVGTSSKLERQDLVVWSSIESTSQVQIHIEPVAK
jgi:hypothetical protein